MTEVVALTLKAYVEMAQFLENRCDGLFIIHISPSGRILELLNFPIVIPILEPV